LGPNEAGKSTALSAFGDALFGFPHRSRHAFLHDMSELRIEFEVCDADGRVHNFVRLKRRKDDLLDGNGNPVQEAILAALIGRRTRIEFEESYGLDGERLRRGGTSLLEGGGEIGQALFSAASGLNGAAATLQKLNADADALYTRRRSATKPFYVALDEHRTALADRNERVVTTKDYEVAASELERIRKAIGADDARKHALEVQRSRHERIRRTLPSLRERTEVISKIRTLGDVPSLPADAGSQAQAARVARDRATARLSDLRQQHEEAEASLSADPPDTTLLSEAEAIDQISEKLSRAEAAIIDRPGQERIAEQYALEIEGCAVRLGLDRSVGADALVSRQPTDVARAALRRLVNAHTGLSQKLRAATEHNRLAQADAIRAANTAAGTNPPADLSTLDNAVREARDAGRIDDDYEHMVTERARAADRLARLLAGLAPRWEHDVAALRSAPVPARADVRRHEGALKKAAEALQDATRARAVAAEALAKAEDRLTATSAAGTLPTETAISEARAQRDRLWKIVRRAHLDGGPAPTADEMAGLNDVPLGNALEDAIRDADALADRRGAEAQRLAEYRQALEDITRARPALARAEDAVLTAVAAQDKALMLWRTAWASCKIEPGKPDVMETWQAARLDVLEAADAFADVERRLDALAMRRAAAQAKLIAAMADGHPTAGDERLAPVLRTAEGCLSAKREAAEAAKNALKDLDAAERRRIEAATELAEAEHDQAAWREQWASALAGATLMPELDPADAEPALSAWDDVASAAKKRDEARRRAQEMRAFIDGFASQTEVLCVRVAPDLIGYSATDAVRTLIERVGAARARASLQSQQSEFVHKLASQIANGVRECQQAENELTALRGVAGVVDDEGLDDAITRAEQLRELISRRDRAELRLQADGDGLPIEALEHEAIGVDPDVVAGRVAETLDDIRTIDAENAERRQQEGALVRQIKDMEVGRDAAEAAQRAVDAAATADEIAARYARIHVARTLLGAALTRFRAEQQAPLLRRASAIFTALTIGSYARLEATEDENDRQILVAVTGNGRRCPADALSEGARDQLYLALRLAALEDAVRSTSAMPFLADDLLASFDDERARAAIEVLINLSSSFQIILFTHHRHIAALLPRGSGDVQVLGDAQVMATSDVA
jgi:uncharacterized protein YhaN